MNIQLLVELIQIVLLVVRSALDHLANGKLITDPYDDNKDDDNKSGEAAEKNMTDLKVLEWVSETDRPLPPSPNKQLPPSLWMAAQRLYWSYQKDKDVNNSMPSDTPSRQLIVLCILAF